MPSTHCLQSISYASVVPGEIHKKYLTVGGTLNMSTHK